MSRVALLEPTFPFAGRNVVWPPPAYANRHIFVRNSKELICASLAAQDDGQNASATPEEQYQALVKEWQDASNAFSLRAKTDEERGKALARVDRLPLQILELVEKYPQDPISLDALVLVVTQEIWLENNILHPGFGKDSREARAIAILLRDHIRSDRLGDACKRVHYGFRQECETFLRTVLAMSPHKEVRALACLRLAQFLKNRRLRLDLLKDQPDMAERYEGLFSKEYLEALKRRDRDKVAQETEALFEQALEKYADVKIPFGGTVGEAATSELYEIHHLAVGKEARDIEGQDQDGQRFKLSDYRGKIVLLYFWSEY